MIELDEGIEALDAAIEFKNETIVDRQQELKVSTALTTEKFLAENERNLFKARLGALSPDESVMLLSKYFVKVVEVRRLTLNYYRYTAISYFYIFFVFKPESVSFL